MGKSDFSNPASQRRFLHGAALKESLMLSMNRISHVASKTIGEAGNCKGRYVIYWGGGEGGVMVGMGVVWVSRGEGHQWNFDVIGEGQGRVMFLDTENISFAKFRMHFQSFKGPKLQNFPGEHAPGPPKLPNACTFTLIVSHSIKHVSITPFGNSLRAGYFQTVTVTHVALMLRSLTSPATNFIVSHKTVYVTKHTPMRLTFFQASRTAHVIV